MKLKKVLKMLTFFTVLIAVLYIVANVIAILTSEFTSFPWWSALVFGGIYFGPLLVVELIALAVVGIIEKRKN